MYEISVITVNYNTSNHLDNCIQSLYRCEKDISFEIIVVDNNSTDRSIDNIKKKYSEIEFLQLDKNYGFGFGCNRGAEISKGKYLFFLNPDIIIQNNSIKHLYDFISTKNEIGTVSGLLTDDNHNLLYCFNGFPTLKWEIQEAFGIGLDKTIGKMQKRKEIKENQPFEIDWAHGACIMIKRNIFEDLKGFDENIFLYYEDVDIQKRIQIAGYKNFCIPYSRYFHYERSSVRDNESLSIYYFYMHTSKLYFFRKYKSYFYSLIIRNIFILGYISKILILPFRKKYKNMRIQKLRHYLIVLGVHTNLKNNI